MAWGFGQAGGSNAEAALDALPDPLCLLDPEGTIVSVNKAWRDFARDNGAAPGADFLGTNYLGVCGTTGPELERTQSFRAALEEVLAGRRVLASLEYPCHAPNEQRWFLATARRCGEEGAVAGVLVTHVNITARRRAEEREVQASEAHRELSALAACLPGVVFQYRFLPDGSGSFPFVSSAVEKLYGLRAEELRVDGSALLARIQPEDLATIVAGLSSEPGTEPRRDEYRVQLPGQAVRWHKADTLASAAADGSVLWQGYISDFTERRLSEVALRESEANLRAVFENVGQGFMLLDPDRTVRFFNRVASDAAAAVVGTPLRLGACIDEWLRPEEREDFATSVRQALAGEQVRAELPFKTPRGQVTFELRYAPVYDPSGQVVAVFYGAQDISERIRAEDNRRELDRQRQRVGKHESLEAMAAGIAHQFNNLLTSIQGNLELARPSMPAQVEPLLDDAGEAVRRAAAISGSLLSYLGQGSRQRRPLPLAGELETLLPKLRAALPEGARFDVALGDGLPWSTIDRPALQQVLLNLVTNAGESFAGKVGAVSLSARRVDDSAQRAESPEAGTWSCLEVVDDGPGMSPQTLERAFDPFFSTRFTGRGLGLSVAQGLVRSHGGVLELESAPGRGTRARIWLPASTPKELTHLRVAAAPEPRAQVDRVPRTGAVLVVDDDAAVLRATRRLLVRLGREVLTAASGEEALNVLSTAHATVGSVVLDLNMPGLDGWAVLGELRRLWPALWVVVASGYDVAQLQSEGRAVVPDGWVQKPFDAEELGRLLEPPRRS